MHDLWPDTGGERVRDLLLRIGAAHDHTERAVLLTRMAAELDRAAEEIAVKGAEVTTRELVAGLRAQAGMVRVMAELERGHQAPRITKAG